MKLKELEHVIDEDTAVSITTETNDGLPLRYPSWKNFKEDVKEEAWDEDVTLRSNAGIQINFINL